jgi:hypothetical protein
MAVTATDSSIFTLFSGLAQELRDQIWRDALPDQTGSALYFYKKGCWCSRRLTESDLTYDPENDELNLIFEWCHGLLDDVQFELPLIFANREARSIALDWLREQGIEIRSREDRQQPVFVRAFDPMRDALYVALDKWDEFLCDPDDRFFQADLEGLNATIETSLTRLAVPEALLHSEYWVTTLQELFRYFYRVEVLLIIVNTQPDLQCVDNDMKLRQQWEFESVQQGAFFWNDGRGGFDFRGGKRVGYEALYRLIEDVIDKVLNKALPKEYIHNFEIRPAFAVRR